METIITIKKNKPAIRALILLAKELEKVDQSSISIQKIAPKKRTVELIVPSKDAEDPFDLFQLLSDFPDADELRNRAWPITS